MTTYAELERNLTHHAPDDEGQNRIEAFRADAKKMARALEEVPDGRAKSIAQTKLEECVMWAIKGMVVPRS